MKKYWITSKEIVTVTRLIHDTQPFFDCKVMPYPNHEKVLQTSLQYSLH